MSRVPQASADFRRSGIWSIYLGPPGALRRLYRSDPERACEATERQLALLLVSGAAALSELLIEAGIDYRAINAVACSSPPGNPLREQAVRCEFCVETEATLERVRGVAAAARLIDQPAATALAARFAHVEFELATRSPIETPTG